MNKLYIIILLAITFFSCNENNTDNKKVKTDMDTVKQISKKSQKIRDLVKKKIIVAHRGSIFFTPEQTEASYRWARNMGADYLELDIQMTKDSILVLFHDKNLLRTTNVKEIFPNKTDLGVFDFTLKELRKLDIGSWFNKENPEKASVNFAGLKILTLKDIMMIAEGYRIMKKENIPVKEIINENWTGNYLYEKDPADNGNRPGLYLETKSPRPNLEKLLAKKITEFGWNINNNPKTIETQKNKIDVANSKARLILISFSRESIKNLEKYMSGIPKLLLLWRPKMEDDLKKNYIDAINFSIENNVQIIGASIAGEPNNYGELNTKWMTDLVHNAGMLVHPYTFDTDKQMEEYIKRIDGINTNRTDLALKYYNRKQNKKPEQILSDLGY